MARRARLRCPGCAGAFPSRALKLGVYDSRMNDVNRASVKKRTSFAGVGCLLQGLGLVSLVLGIATFATVLGPIVFFLLGLWLIVAGSRRSQWWECSACGTRLARKKVEVCPNCRSRFG